MNNGNKSKETLEQRLERRRKKFSTESRDSILNDPLRSKALLSRSTDAGIESLMISQDRREEFLNYLKVDGHDHLEHGLRKLREIVVSIYDHNTDDVQFVQWAFIVYKMSYDFFMDAKDFNKLGALVLNFMVDKLPPEMVKEYTEVYIINLSHVARDMDKCLTVLRKTSNGDQLDQFSHDLLELCLIYAYETKCPSEWFRIVSTLPSGSLIYAYVTKSPMFSEMKRRGMEIIQKCYRQIPTIFMEEWFSGFIHIEEVRGNNECFTTSKGNEIMVFKKGRKSLLSK